MVSIHFQHLLGKNTSWASWHCIHLVSGFKPTQGFSEHHSTERRPWFVYWSAAIWGEKGREKAKMETGLYWWNYCKVKTLSPIFFHTFIPNKSHNCIYFHCLQSTDSVPKAGHPGCCRNSQGETVKSVKVIPKNELNKVVSNEYQLCMAQWKPFKGTCVWTYFPSQQRFRFFTLRNDSWKESWPGKEILPRKSPKRPKKN